MIEEKEDEIIREKKTRWSWGCFFIGLLIFITLIIGGLIAYRFYQEHYQYPVETGAKDVSYTWSYQGASYSFDARLYASSYEYYRRQAKGIITGDEEASIDRYLKRPTEDKSIDQVTESLKGIAVNAGLDSNQQAELIISFVQSLPYDEARAIIDKTHPRYPYETLYDGQGICSDKSLLAIVILREFSFGAAVFLFPDQAHMAPAIQCPASYDNFDSGYCIAEATTIGNRIGIIPDIDTSGGKAVIKTFSTYGETNAINSQKLTTVNLLNQTSGQLYSGVIETASDLKKITDLKNALEDQEKKIISLKTELEIVNAQMEAYLVSKNISAYNLLIPRQNTLVRQYNAAIAEYNRLVNEYNALVKKLSVL